MTPAPSSQMRCFGPFRLDIETGELSKGTRRIRLQGQALRILLCLLEEPGRFRTREELRSRLWPNGTFVDFDHSLNVAVNRLRERLGDSAENPRYIETVPGVGYRFAVAIEDPRPPAEPAPPDQVNAGQAPRIPKWRFVRATAIGACTILAAGLSIWFVWERQRGDALQSRIDSIAVLPLANLTHDDDDAFADGMTEELITELARIGSLRVISRTSIMRFKDTARPLAEIARELNVNAVVEGTVRRSRDRVRITVQLIQTSPEHHIWAEAFEGDIRDVLSLQRDVAGKIGNRIQAKLAPLRARKRLDPETHEDYLRGQYFLVRRNPDALNKAVGYFQEALQRDQQYAEAYAGLAVAYDLLGMYEVRPPGETFSRVKDLASRALALDSTLSEAYTARAAAASFWEFDWEDAEKDFQLAIASDPNSAFAHHWYGEHLINVGKAERAVSELKRARELDPLSLPVNATLGRVYRDARRFDEAVRQCYKTIELDPNFSLGHWCLAQAYVGGGQYAAAIPELEKANALGTTPLVSRDLGFAYAAAGKHREAKAFLGLLQKKAQSAYVAPYLIAAIYAGLREKDEAFKYLERAYSERDSHITYLALDPEMDPLRSDPRFALLIQRLKLPK